jgi:catechol 2,3-dioxygenase-like lactoylglutathione lyase family enzyme
MRPVGPVAAGCEAMTLRGPTLGSSWRQEIGATMQPHEDEPVTGFSYGLHHVQLALPPGGEDACRKFYVGLLGMVEVRKPAVLAARGGLWVRADRLEIHLGVEEKFTPQRKAHPGILVGDIDAVAARLTSHEWPVTWDDDFPGMRRFYTHDSHGNRLEFLQPQGSSE